MSPGEISTADLAELLGVTPHAVNDAARRGIIEKTGRGTWPMPDAVQRYVQNLRDAAAGREAEASTAEDRRAVLRATAEEKQLNVAERRRELVKRSDVDKVAKAAVVACREALLRIGARVGPHLAPVGTAAGCAQIVDAAVRDALDELAGLEVVAADGD